MLRKIATRTNGDAIQIINRQSRVILCGTRQWKHLGVTSKGGLEIIDETRTSPYMVDDHPPIVRRGERCELGLGETASEVGLTNSFRQVPHVQILRVAKFPISTDIVIHLIGI